MTRENEKGIETFENWIKYINDNNYRIHIPDYQRAYAWDKDNAEILLDDLQKNDDYFLGLFLLEENKAEKLYSLIDGQQRFTTLFMLIFALRDKINNEKQKSTVEEFIYYDEGNQHFRLSLQETQNRTFFANILQGNKPETKYLSQNKITEVLSFFQSNAIEADKILSTIFNSNILIYTEADTGKAMQIFELLNDRGKALTNLEALKSFIMNQICIKIKDKHTQQDKLTPIKECFANIYGSLNEMKFDEDAILRYHYIAFEEWGNKEDYANVKDSLKGIIQKQADVLQIENKTEAIAHSFKLLHEIQQMATGGKHPWLKNIYTLGRIATFYPLLLAIKKQFPNDESFFELICNYLELFTYRAFGIMNKRSNTAETAFHHLARDVGTNKKNQESIIETICDIMNKQVGILTATTFTNDLKDVNFYENQRGIDGRYFLIKYENYLQTVKGKETNFITEDKKLTVEHIVAQNIGVANPEDYYRNITRGVDTNKLTKRFKDEGLKNYPKNYFQDKFMNSLGNLVISKHAANASKGNNIPEEKAWEVFQSQLDIGQQIKDNQNQNNESWRKEYPFTVDEMDERQTIMIAFAETYWSCQYFTDIDDENKMKDIKERKPLI